MSNSIRKSPRILIAGGGTGGHVFPALAIKQALVRRNKDATVVFAGTRQGLEAVVIPREGETLKKIWISGFSRGNLFRNIFLPIKLAVSFAQSLILLSRFRPHVVIGTGGYVMGPVLWTAQQIKIPTLIQEQNSFPGYTTRKLAQRASVVCAGFEDVKKSLPNTRIEFTGNPLRESFTVIEWDKAQKRWMLDADRKTILVFGGSAGARSINEAIAGTLNQLLMSYNVIWQTGRLGIPSSVDHHVVEKAASEKHLIVCEFIDDMVGAYAVADLAVCRAGAMTLAELAMSGLPAILIPYPFATDDHQTANAKSVVEQKAAAWISDRDLTADKLLSVIRECIEDKSGLTRMASCMKSLSRPEAADRIAEITLSLADKK